MTRRILVTGGTGNVGRQVVAQLLDVPGVAVRALVRRAAAGLPVGVEVVGGDLGVPGGLGAALDGVDAVFLVWPLHSGAALPGVLEAVGSRRVVLLGSGGVRDLDPEGQRRLLGPAGTFVMPSTFAANARWWARQVRAGDVVRGIHGGLGMAVLHEADIAAVAVRALVEEGHGGACHRLTGPAVVGQAEQVRTIGEVIGRPVRWEEVGRAEARARMLADDFPESFVDVLLDGYARMAAGPPPVLTDTVRRVTGVPARPFRRWVADHAAEFAA